MKARFIAYEFDELVLPLLIDALLMKFSYGNTHERKKVYKNILNALNKDLDGQEND